MEKRIYNFSAGPAILPEDVLKEAQENLMSLPGVGMSVLEISHRSKTFDDIISKQSIEINTGRYLFIFPPNNFKNCIS